jgi:hypothetical protein
MPQNKIQLIYLPKQYGGRIEAHTFKAVCTARTNSDTSGWLIAHKRLDTEGDQRNDMITSIIKAYMGKTPVIVKIQEPGRAYEREARVMRLLGEHNIPNTIQHICDFTCKDNILAWKKPFTIPRPFCEGKGEHDIHLIVMEYIEHTLRDELRKRILPTPIIKNIIKQLMYLVLQLWYQIKMTHGDLFDGNFLLDIGEQKTNTYTIGSHIRQVDTLGYEPILIDFQMASISIYKNNKHTFGEVVLDQPLRIMYLFGHYLPDYDIINNKLQNVKNLTQLLNIIDTLL